MTRDSQPSEHVAGTKRLREWGERLDIRSLGMPSTGLQVSGRQTSVSTSISCRAWYGARGWPRPGAQPLCFQEGPPGRAGPQPADAPGPRTTLCKQQPARSSGLSSGVMGIRAIFPIGEKFSREKLWAGGRVGKARPFCTCCWGQPRGG